MQLLAISGSLRAESTNTALLTTLSRFVPHDTNVLLYREMGKLPIFNPDLEIDSTPAAVVRLAEQVERSDGLIICSPEYAHGIPGGIKNLLDWLVSRIEIVDKPILLIHASHRGDMALSALHEVLRTLSKNTVTAVTIRVPLISLSPPEVQKFVNQPEYVEMISKGLQDFVNQIGG